MGDSSRDELEKGAEEFEDSMRTTGNRSSHPRTDMIVNHIDYLVHVLYRHCKYIKTVMIQHRSRLKQVNSAITRKCLVSNETPTCSS